MNRLPALRGQPFSCPETSIQEVPKMAIRKGFRGFHLSLNGTKKSIPLNDMVHNTLMHNAMKITSQAWHRDCNALTCLEKTTQTQSIYPHETHPF
jgi:hypothetical protein